MTFTLTMDAADPRRLGDFWGSSQMTVGDGAGFWTGLVT